jgi:hypothetical protein
LIDDTPHGWEAIPWFYLNSRRACLLLASSTESIEALSLLIQVNANNCWVSKLT